jgi:hypothetical protein
MAALERSSWEQSEKVKLLEARVETLEQDNSALKEKASKLQEKVKAAAKEKKGIFFFLSEGESFQAAGEGQSCCQGEERYFLLSSVSLE